MSNRLEQKTEMPESWGTRDLRERRVTVHGQALAASVLLDLHRSMQRIRHTEETIARLYPQQEMRTPTHLGTGQEAVAAGVAAAVRRDDALYSHHRCHNHYLACGGSVYRLAAELYGRVDGAARGRGGSVHLTDRDNGFIVSSAILGQTVAVATGSALAFRMDGVDRVAVTFFGEATCEEGVIYESMNFAAINRLPVIYVCENNLYSTESPLSVRQPPGTELCARAESFSVPAEKVDGNDVAAVYLAARRAVDRARSGAGPSFIECMTYRWREHVGPQFDHDAGRTYRTKEEFDLWVERCPLKQSAARLISLGLADEREISAWAAEIEKEVVADFERARRAPWPEAGDLFDYL
ncbi:MAG: thiamine pyrophosphate-dependent dehydrogenase E1 component subunit alpha [Alphaproteobacteria bacterium]|nr:MAG: thiamine pyrophosphate-dependent dehydrogenase E1 component subunit alpha [Alphaproteobacteria bacterium]